MIQFKTGCKNEIKMSWMFKLFLKVELGIVLGRILNIPCSELAKTCVYRKVFYSVKKIRNRISFLHEAFSK